MFYDLIVIGGGPSGMMAAGRAGERGARVLLLEKNDCLGRKLLLTGNGRCNLTNEQADDKASLGVYGKNAKFFFSSFNKFGVESTRRFFSDQGISTITEDNGRVFPESNQAGDVRQALLKYLEKNKVEIRYNAGVAGFVVNGKKIEKVKLINGEEIAGNNFLIATGGRSFPATGSSGEAYDWLTRLGHTVNPPRPALTPVIVKDRIVKKLEGASLQDIGISVFAAGKKITSRRGNIIFTADGVSGPAILDLSGLIGGLLPSSVRLELDLFPETKEAQLEKRIQSDFHQGGNKLFKNFLIRLTSPKLAPGLLELLSISESKETNAITKEERGRLVKILKSFSLEVKGLKDFDRAMITAGGAAVSEVDPKTMRSRIISNLFLAGEILDLDGPSGGYNLQICWSTGFAAGDSAAD